MTTALAKDILTLTGASKILRTEAVQTLWSGYGEIVRYFLEGAEQASIIVKHICWPNAQNHPRGWNTEISHQRKLKSYQVEQCWYEAYAARTTPQCRVPRLYQVLEMGGEVVLIMEDLNASGFHRRLSPDTVTMAAAKSGLRWLAHFHAAFLGVVPEGLWPVGTYWHLATRPDEWAGMPHQALKQAAQHIDARLNGATYQTLVHGDAKLANFCFGETDGVAAVDFQYVGQGCGMKDVAYFISSCLHEDDCERHEAELLGCYFQHLGAAVAPGVNVAALLAEWRGLYRYAWADYYRFLDGWSPGHWKMHRYSKRLTEQVLNELANGPKG